MDSYHFDPTYPIFGLALGVGISTFISLLMPIVYSTIVTTIGFVKAYSPLNHLVPPLYSLAISPFREALLELEKSQ